VVSRTSSPIGGLGEAKAEAAWAGICMPWGNSRRLALLFSSLTRVRGR
jgi:hypothetical protein